MILILPLLYSHMVPMDQPEAAVVCLLFFFILPLNLLFLSRFSFFDYVYSFRFLFSDPLLICYFAGSDHSVGHGYTSCLIWRLGYISSRILNLFFFCIVSRTNVTPALMYTTSNGSYHLATLFDKIMMPIYRGKCNWPRVAVYHSGWQG